MVAGAVSRGQNERTATAGSHITELKSLCTGLLTCPNGSGAFPYVEEDTSTIGGVKKNVR